MEKVSVVIPAYNEEDNIEDCITAIMRQKVHEVIVVNDCSTDRTREILDKLSERYDFDVVDNIVNEGYRDSLVEGFNRSTGDILIFTDADSIVSDYAVSTLIQHYYNNGADAVFGYVDVRNIQYLHPLVCKIGKKYNKDRRYGGALFSVRRSVLEQIGVFPELGKRGGYDVELMERLREGGYNIVYEDDAKVYSNFPHKISDVLRRKYWAGKTYVIHAYEHPQCFSKKAIIRGTGFYGVLFLSLALFFISKFLLLLLGLLVAVFFKEYTSRAVEVYRESGRAAFLLYYYAYELAAGVLRIAGYLSEWRRLVELW